MATITSEKGFYVGDICYEMSDEDYDADWSNDFEDFEGEHELHGHKFAVGLTADGDGTYEDQYGNRYPVDAGNIGILPYELCESKNEDEIESHGRFIEAKKATFNSDDGVFDIEFDNGEHIHINTDDECDDYDDYYENYEEDEYDDDEYDDED